ncbi:MAG: prepilin peptidase [Candidatus Shapirobacteria bacterium]|nr:prepilin peptidase [Candidatus Shapirobacteria bacterium]
MTIFIFVFGIAIGSFIDCLVYRLNKEKNFWKRFLKGRSYCPRCKHQLAWFENIPLCSFFLQKGKCRHCHSLISWRYPLVELFTGLIFVGVYKWWLIPNFNPSSDFYIFISLFCQKQTYLYLYIFLVLLAVFLSDLFYWTIPDQITFPAILIFFIWNIIQGQWLSILAGLAGVIFFLLLVFLTKGKGMGLGDVKLVGLMGLFLGFPRLIVALYLAFLTGAITGVILILIKKKRIDSRIPFGPFLALSAFVALFWGEKIWQFFL